MTQAQLSDNQLKAIHDGNIAVLDTFVNSDNLNDCYEVKNSSYGFLAISIKMKSLASLKYFVEKGADLEVVCTGKTPLMYSVKYGRLEMVKYLIGMGAKPDAKTLSGRTALSYAKKYKQLEIEAYLLGLKN
ncbi:MAG: ankyrin repeat domain-containing protein [Flavobacteriaceae bacterium]